MRPSYLSIYLSSCISIYLSIYLCVYIYICIYIYIQREREREGPQVPRLERPQLGLRRGQRRRHPGISPTKSFCKSQFPHKSVNVLLRLVAVLRQLIIYISSSSETGVTFRHEHTWAFDAANVADIQVYSNLISQNVFYKSVLEKLPHKIVKFLFIIAY